MAEILVPGKTVRDEADQFVGIYRCEKCGAVVSLDRSDVGHPWSHGYAVHDFDGRGKRIRIIPRFDGFEGTPCCQADAWLWEVK